MKVFLILQIRHELLDPRLRLLDKPKRSAKLSFDLSGQGALEQGHGQDGKAVCTGGELHEETE